MIQVKRGVEPDGFTEQSVEWQVELKKTLEKNPKTTTSTFWTKIRNRAKMKVYAEKLQQVFYSKCVYCESKSEHVASLQVEHYRPKSMKEFYDQMFIWENWLISCGNCNTSKGTKFPYCDDKPCLINPADEDPSEHLDFLNAQILFKTSRGEKTIKLMKLDRSVLVEERAFWLNQINYAILLLCNIPKAYFEAREFLIWSMQPNSPYTAMIRAYLCKVTPKLANPKIPHTFIELYNPLEKITKLVEQYSDQLKQIE